MYFQMHKENHKKFMAHEIAVEYNMIFYSFVHLLKEII